jgi:oxygen-dependent protoporphyrinogen oxidase
VARWERAIPQYAVGHRERMEVIETALLGWPAVALAGAAYRGSGITDCIVQGRDAAGRVLEDRRHV